MTALEKIYNKLVAMTAEGAYSELGEVITEIASMIVKEDAKKAAKGWRFGEGQIMFGVDGVTEMKTISGYHNPNHPGVMIHKKVAEAAGLLVTKGGGWAITHESSGLSINRSDLIFPSMAKAVMAFNTFLAEIDWGQSRDELMEDSDALQAFNAMNKSQFVKKYR